MKKLRLIIVLAWMLWIMIHNTAFGVQFTPENGIIKASLSVSDRIIDNIHLEPFANESALDCGLFCIAINSHGETAIVSKSSGEKCYFIICVYSPNGSLKYGYKVDFDTLKGTTALFYDEADNLCLKACYMIEDENGHAQFPGCVVAIDPAGIRECYAITDESTFDLTSFSEINGIEVMISPDSDFRIAQLEKAYLRIENCKTGASYVIFDHAAEYENIAAKDRMNYIILMAITCGTIIFVSVLILKIRSKDTGYK